MAALPPAYQVSCMPVCFFVFIFFTPLVFLTKTSDVLGFLFLDWALWYAVHQCFVSVN